MSRVVVKFNEHNTERDLVGKAKRFLLDFMFSVEKEAKRKCPVDTGRLRASIHTSPTVPSERVMVSDGVEYGVFQEFGTMRMKSQSFMRPALKIVKARDTKRLLKKHGL